MVLRGDLTNGQRSRWTNRYWVPEEEDDLCKLAMHWVFWLLLMWVKYVYVPQQWVNLEAGQERDWSSITRWRERICWLWNLRWIHRVATENSDTCDQVAQAVTLRWKALLWGGTLSHQIILNKTRNWDVANGVGSGGDVVNSLSKSHIFII